MKSNNQKKTDSILVGAIVWAILFLGMGLYKLIIKKNFDVLDFSLGGLSLVFLIYLLKKTKANLNERHEDERKKYISEKSSSISYEVHFLVITVLSFLVLKGKIIISSSSTILIVLGSALIIKSISYLICRYKY